MELRLETGRTHQARVHISWALGPIVGDARYGDDRAGRLADADESGRVGRIGLLRNKELLFLLKRKP